MMAKRRTDPLAGPAGALVKFVISAAVGGLASLVIALGILSAGFDGFWESRWVHILWIIPMVWGVLGVFFYVRLLDVARAVVEGFFEVGP